MPLFTEPIPISDNDPNAAHVFNAYLQELFFNAKFLQLTQRGGSIQNHDKAGNLDGKWVVFTSNVTPDGEDAVPHKLGRVPLGFFACVPDKASFIYRGTTQWTATTIYVKSSAASVAWKLLLF